MSKTRAYCFTINNPTQDDIDTVNTIACEYIVYGREVGEGNTPHLQGYVHFKDALTVAAMSKRIPRAHLEARRGTVDEAVNYCKKDGDFTERGIKPKSQKEKGANEKQRWRTIIAKAEDGDEEWLKEEEPKVYATMSQKLKSLRKREASVMQGDLPHEWWYGPTGTGKSSKLWQDHPDHFQKKKSKWWDGYDGQSVVALEEWSPANEKTADSLKEWADRYPFTGEIKGGTLQRIRPAKIIVLSNYTIDECFEHESDREPLKRRFKVVLFGESPQEQRPKGGHFIDGVMYNDT